MPQHVYTKMTQPKTANERVLELQQICQSKDWAQKLAQRWKVSVATIRRWVACGLLGLACRRNLNRIEVSTMAVLAFEERWAAALSVGEPVLSLAQVAKRYGVSVRTVQFWRAKHRFPTPERVPTSMMLRWRVSQLVPWDRMFGINPENHNPQ